MKLVSSYSLKGGVGKTTTVFHLTVAAAEAGWRVLLWDLDSQGASTFLLRSSKAKGHRLTKVAEGSSNNVSSRICGTNFEGLDILPFGFETSGLEGVFSKLKTPNRGSARVMDQLSKEYDVIFVDLPPSAGSLVSSILLQSDVVLYLTTATPLALRSLWEFLDVWGGSRVAKKRLHIVVNMLERRRPPQLRALDMLQGDRRLTLLETIIPKSTLADRVSETQIPIYLTHPKSQLAIAYRQLYMEVADILCLDKESL